MRSRPAGFVLVAAQALLLVMLLPLQRGAARSNEEHDADAQALKLLISVEQQTLTEPFPARLTLHLHNAGKQVLWLYRRARGRRAPARTVIEENRQPETRGGSTLVATLEPAGNPPSRAVSTPAEVTVFESVGLPRPKLVRLNADDNYEEKATLRLMPALDETQKPIWGRYLLSVNYQADYSNADEVRRNLGLTVWQGEVASNTVEVELAPAPAPAQGSIGGSIIGPDSRPVLNARVSLSDEQERLVDQVLSDVEGRLTFTHLPLGLYWVTVRREFASEDTTVFRHVELTPAEPAGALQLMILPPEIYEPQKVLHKPVIFRVTDTAGQPLEKVQLEITWSNGPVLDNVKGQTAEDGAVALELIPGRNFVTLKRRGCPKDEQRVEVAAGDGIDDFKLQYSCMK